MLLRNTEPVKIRLTLSTKMQEGTPDWDNHTATPTEALALL
jgi:hypothetical protein